MHKKHSPSLLLSCMSLLLVLLFAFNLSVGNAYGRYSTQYRYDITGKAKTVSPFLFDDEVATKSYLFKSDADSWSTSGGEQTLQFVLKNHIAEQVSKEDIYLRIRPIVIDVDEETVEENVADNEMKTDEADVGEASLNFTLSLDDDQPINSTPDYLSTASHFYQQNQQNGWYYCFNKNNAEVLCLLEGGKNSDITVTLTVQNTDLDCSRIWVCVDRVR